MRLVLNTLYELLAVPGWGRGHLLQPRRAEYASRSRYPPATLRRWRGGMGGSSPLSPFIIFLNCLPLQAGATLHWARQLGCGIGPSYCLNTLFSKLVQGQVNHILSQLNSVFQGTQRKKTSFTDYSKEINVLGHVSLQEFGGCFIMKIGMSL